MERWRPIPGWSNYELSNKGRVRAIARRSKSGRWLPERILKVNDNRVNLVNDERHYTAKLSQVRKLVK